ncbi:MAG: glycosyltransferase [Acidimicrobiales bacterium]|nr:glycosyltransferase [Acidimicrobiales bacterium]
MHKASSEPAPARVRVLWLIKGLGPGGAEQLLVNQARVHDRERFEMTAAYLVPWKNHLVGPLEAAGVPALLLDGSRDFDLRWVWRLRRHLADTPVDVVHSHSPLVAAGARLVAQTLPRAKRPALMYTEHNRWPRHNRLTRLANRLTFSLDDDQIAVSDDVRDTIPSRLRTRVTTLFHGIVLDEVRAQRSNRHEVRTELGIDEKTVVIGTVANFRREKDYPNLLRAAQLALARTDVPLCFVAVGQGPLEAEVHELHRQLGLGDRFRLLGYRQDAVRMISAFDLFTLASRHEGLPVSLMEALALGVPVVATAVGGIPQAITDGAEGLIVPPRRPDLLAAAYCELAVDPGRRHTMSDAASARSKLFDIRTATRELEERYADLAERRRR